MSVVAIPVAAKAGQEAASLGASIAKAATSPIVSRRKVVSRETVDGDPEVIETQFNISPLAILVAGLLGIGAAAVGQRAIRTGTVEVLHPPKKVKAPNPEWASWKSRQAAREADAKRQYYVDPTGLYEPGSRGRRQREQAAAAAGTGDPEPPKTILIDDPDGATTTRFKLRSRDNIADYNPIGKLL